MGIARGARCVAGILRFERGGYGRGQRARDTARPLPILGLREVPVEEGARRAREVGFEESARDQALPFFQPSTAF
jgi:hypothetical protein